MAKASICTIGDEILIGQIVDTNSSLLASHLGGLGIIVSSMYSLPDRESDIVSILSRELENNDIVITTGGLGPTKDDITKKSLARLFGASGWRQDAAQLEINRAILHSRGLDLLEENLAQSLVPDCCEVINNEYGTAPILVFHKGNKFLYCLPGVPHEVCNVLAKVMKHIEMHFHCPKTIHRNLMTFGLAESALSKKIEDWETSLPPYIHLAYLPNTLSGVKLRLSLYDATKDGEEELERRYSSLKAILKDEIYAEGESSLQEEIAKLLCGSTETLSAAESCTGGKISELITGIPGVSSFYLGSVTSYAISVKEKVLGVNDATIEKYGVVSEEVAEEMARGVRSLAGSTYSVATTGLAGPGGDGMNPEGTVCIAVDGPLGSRSRRFQYKNDRKRNIERFAAAALDMLRRYIIEARTTPRS